MNNLIDRNGQRFSTPELAAASNARIARAAAEREAAEKAEAEAWENALKEKFMSTPGATEADWQRNRQGVIDDARKAAALSADDRARQTFRRTYA